MDEGGGFGGEGGSGDDLYDQAVAVVTRDRKASTSYIQRRLQIGYNRAASRLMEKMEQRGRGWPGQPRGQARHPGGAAAGLAHRRQQRCGVPVFRRRRARARAPGARARAVEKVFLFRCSSARRWRRRRGGKWWWW